MRARRAARGGASHRDHDLARGPGRLTQAMAIGLAQNEADLSCGDLRLHARIGPPPEIEATPRIGISRAQEHLWRFAIRGSNWVSGR
jgi:DNA-3-methyladenine glycosylase